MPQYLFPSIYSQARIRWYESRCLPNLYSRGTKRVASGSFHPYTQHPCRDILPLHLNLQHAGYVSSYRTLHLGWNQHGTGRKSRSIKPESFCYETFTLQRSVNEGLWPYILRPYAYCPTHQIWMPWSGVEAIRRGHVLNIASWNLHCSASGPEARTSAAMFHLRTIFGKDPQNTVIMFQEITQEALEIILADTWARKSFVVSDIEPPDCRYEDDEFSDPDPPPRVHFTLMMLSKALPISNCFCVPFRSQTGRDALVVDIPIVPEDGCLKQTEESVLRLCTTHLESMETGNEYRFPQLCIVSELLKGKFSKGKRVHAGLVGGDMNSILESEDDYHRAPEVDLRDAWEDERAPELPTLNQLQKDPTYDRSRGSTWGCQSKRPYRAKRLDKFYYTGFIEVLEANKAQDATGKVGRFGIGVHTTIGTNYKIWASDHFGVTVIVKVV